MVNSSFVDKYWQQPPLWAQANSPLTPPATVMQASAGVVRGQGTQLLDTNGNLQANLPAGALVILLGRTMDGERLYVQSLAEGEGWVAAGSLLTVGTTTLPVQDFVTTDLPDPATPSQALIAATSAMTSTTDDSTQPVGAVQPIALT